MNILLLRHGKTAYNEEGRYLSRTDLPLSAGGMSELCSRAVFNVKAGIFCGAKFYCQAKSDLNAAMTCAADTAAPRGPGKAASGGAAALAPCEPNAAVSCGSGKAPSGKADADACDDKKDPGCIHNIHNALSFPKCIYVSPMLRARQSADILFPGIPKAIVPGFTEMDFGAFEGRTYMEMQEDPDYRSWVDSGCLTACPGGESKEQFCSRVCQTFESVINSHIYFAGTAAAMSEALHMTSGSCDLEHPDPGRYGPNDLNPRCYDLYDPNLRCYDPDDLDPGRYGSYDPNPKRYCSYDPNLRRFDPDDPSLRCYDPDDLDLRSYTPYDINPEGHIPGNYEISKNNVFIYRNTIDISEGDNIKKTDDLKNTDKINDITCSDNTDGIPDMVIIAHGGVQMAIMERYALPEKPYFSWHAPCGGGFLLGFDPGLWHSCKKLQLISAWL